MARLIGLDIRSRTVRAVLLVTGYRRTVLESMVEVDRSQIPGLEDAVQACLLPIAAHADALAVAVDGDLAFLHRLSLPLTAEKQLAEVVPFELEAQVPVDFEELVYDYLLFPRRAGDSTIELLAVAVRTTVVRDLLAAVKTAIAKEVERVGVGALPLANLSTVTPEVDGEEPVALLELAEDRSEIVVLRRGRPEFARTLSIGVSGLPASAPELAANLRQSLVAARARLGASIGAIHLTGGGAAAAGAEAYLSAELGIPVAPLPLPRLEGIPEGQEAMVPRFSRALGLALGLRGRARDLDLRRGSLSYQRGYAFFKEKAPLLSALGAVILLSFFFSTWAELRSLGREHGRLAAELARTSREALDEESDDPEHVKELLDGVGARLEVDPMPHADAFDVMVELSRAVPVAVTHDVEELELSREHVKLEGIVGSAAEAQQVADAVKQNRCFADVKVTKVSQVINGTRQKYVMEADLRCPEDATARKRAETEEGDK